jgi:lysophospholipase L1-like esterase
MSPPSPHRRIGPRFATLASALTALLLGGTLGVPSTLAQNASLSPTQPVPASKHTGDCGKAAREHLFEDFAGLSRYGAADAALPAAMAGQRRVVFMGDSITDFWATVDPQFFSRTDYIDRGISGQTTMQMLLRFRQDVIALKPAVVHMLGGTNDIAGNTGPMDLPAIEANMASMIDLARANGIQVIIGSILPATNFSWCPAIEPGPKIIELNEWLRSYSKSRHLIYVDYHTALTDGELGMKSEFTSDGVHPTLSGYAVMDRLAHAAIREALLQPPNQARETH